MNISITRMDPQPPVMNIDQNLLVELSRLFPQIPSHVIVSFIHQVRFMLEMVNSSVALVLSLNHGWLMSEGCFISPYYLWN